MKRSTKVTGPVHVSLSPRMAMFLHDCLVGVDDNPSEELRDYLARKFDAVGIRPGDGRRNNREFQKQCQAQMTHIDCVHPELS